MYKKIYTLDSVILSPHIAGWTNESKYKIGNLLSEKIISYCKWEYNNEKKTKKKLKFYNSMRIAN